MIIYLLCLLLFSIGIYCILRKRNIIKIIVGVIISEYAVNLFLVLLAYRPGPSGQPAMAPILTGDNAEVFASQAVDPLPQAMVLTAIVISLAVLALAITIAMRLYQKYGTYDIGEIRRLRG